jgi:hypothetical protein
MFSVGFAGVQQWTDRRLLLTLTVLGSFHFVAYTAVSVFDPRYWWIKTAATEPLYAYLIIGIFCWWIASKRKLALAIFVSLLVLPQLYYVNHKQWVYDIKFPFRRLPQDTRIIAFAPSDLDFSLASELLLITDRVEFGNFARTELTLLHETRLLDLQRYGLRMLGRNFVIEGMDCDSKAAYRETWDAFVLSTNIEKWLLEVQKRQGTLFSELHFGPPPSNTLSVTFEPCSADTPRMLAELFSQVGNAPVALVGRR